MTIRCDWRGELPPLSAPLEIVERAGVDIRPADPSDPEARARMLAYVWPDQIERLARLEAALSYAASQPWRVERASAGDWLEAKLDSPQPAGRTRVVMHSIMWQYMPADAQARIAVLIAEAGERAAADAPLAWLRMEPDARKGSAAVTLTLWPGGEERILGRADFHGRWAEWRPPEPI